MTVAGLEFFGEATTKILDFDVSSLVFSGIPVDRSPTPEELVKGIGRKENIDRKIVRTIPKGCGEIICLNFFSLKVPVNNERLSALYKALDMIPADPYSLAAFHDLHADFVGHTSTFWSRNNYMDLRVRAEEPTLDIFTSKVRIWLPGVWFAGIYR